MCDLNFWLIKWVKLGLNISYCWFDGWFNTKLVVEGNCKHSFYLPCQEYECILWRELCCLWPENCEYEIPLTTFTFPFLFGYPSSAGDEFIAVDSGLYWGWKSDELLAFNNWIHRRWSHYEFVTKHHWLRRRRTCDEQLAIYNWLHRRRPGNEQFPLYDWLRGRWPCHEFIAFHHRLCWCRSTVIRRAVLLLLLWLGYWPNKLNLSLVLLSTFICFKKKSVVKVLIIKNMAAKG